MPHFAVIREAGAGWLEGKGIYEQPQVADHAAFMNGLAKDGFLLFAGPLGGGDDGLFRALLIVQAEDEAEIRDRLADDPWTRASRLAVASAEPWNVIVGAERLESRPTAAAAPADRL
jgi:hypothetical protein